MRSITALFLATFAAAAQAHPGEHHGSLLSSLWHLATAPDHLAMLAVAIIVGVGFALKHRGRGGRVKRSGS